jgi:hypothetical protein
MEFKVGDWFKEEWDEKAPEPGRAYYVIDKVEGGVVSLRRFAIFDKKPEMNSWRKMGGVETEKIERRLKLPVTDAAEIARLKALFEGLPEALDPM